MRGASAGPPSAQRRMQPPPNYPGTKGKSGPLGAAFRQLSSLEVSWHLAAGWLTMTSAPRMCEAGPMEPGQQPPMCMPSAADRGFPGGYLAPHCTTKGGAGRGCTSEGCGDTRTPCPALPPACMSPMLVVCLLIGSAFQTHTVSIFLQDRV